MDAELSGLILTALRLSAISEYFVKGMLACAEVLVAGIIAALQAPEPGAGAGAGAVPTGGVAAREGREIDNAARQLAEGHERLVVLLLSAIVAYLAGRGALKRLETVAARSAQLRGGYGIESFRLA